MSGKSILLIVSALLMGAPLNADPTPQAMRYGFCADDVRTGFHFYCDPEEETEELQAPPPPIPEAKMPDQTEPAVKTATERVMAFRKQLDEIKHRAVLEPTEENVLGYMQAQKRMTDMAGDFTDQWQRILYKTPELDANIDFPLSSLGSQIYQDEMRKKRTEAFREAARTRGLLFIFEGPEACPVCTTQAEIMVRMRDTYEVTLLAVTMDGSYPPEIPETLPDNGQVAALGLDDYPRPIIGLVDPSSGAVDVVGSGLLTEDHILERIHVLTQVPVGDRF